MTEPTQTPPRAQVFELFPTPVMRVEGCLDAALVTEVLAQLGEDLSQANHRSEALAHSRLLSPEDAPLLRDVAQRLDAPLREFGTLLFGEALQWRLKEMWLNVMQAGGQQAVHNHANSFASGILYLSDCEPASNTAFVRSLGGRDYVFSNANPRSATGPFNAERWIGPTPSAGDLLLFPSYLLHEVPVNRGATRSTLAFNAMPHRLDAWGYAMSFSN
ncbi:TIGR02466 family protein [Variovorax sp. 770b2]|uniref:TIGR02466 family protein n=1 Tax=Variovorax sp. 770b2 TaxID=1566271 RepID=UPI0008E593EE|nr:TIGR02466 family protein [Variovorax sp. 770b2]SFQ40383.1 conserved hypothetical protein [Variovorax sp. 770b2]